MMHINVLPVFIIVGLGLGYLQTRQQIIDEVNKERVHMARKMKWEN